MTLSVEEKEQKRDAYLYPLVQCLVCEVEQSGDEGVPFWCCVGEVISSGHQWCILDEVASERSRLHVSRCGAVRWIHLTTKIFT